MLADEGWRATTVADADSALRALQCDPPSAILLDLGVPGDRELFMRSWQAAGSNALIPIIVVSGATEIPEEMLELGVFRQISKPFELDAVLAALESCIRPTGGAGG
jgi:DNA-binding response OmpR family regulator